MSKEQRAWRRTTRNTRGLLLALRAIARAWWSDDGRGETRREGT